MGLGVDDAAKEFGKIMGGKAAVAVCGWFKRLKDAEGFEGRKQLEEVVEPIFAKFQEIYEAYVQSFREYREELSKADSEQQIRAVIRKIEGDLRFTAQDRVDLLSHLSQTDDGVFAVFVRAITDFLVSNEASLSGNAEDSLAPPEIACQVMRRGLIADLEAALDPWAAALDPACSGPPLMGDELDSTLDALGRRHGVAKDDPQREAKLRVGLAVDSLDARMDAMVAAYKLVRREYEKLKTELAGS